MEKEIRKAEGFIDKRKAMEEAVSSIVSRDDPTDVDLKKIYDRAQCIKKLSYLRSKSVEERKHENMKENWNVEDEYLFVAPGYAKQAGQLMIVRPRIVGIRSSDVLETKKPRKFPSVSSGPERDTDNFEIALPAEYEVDDLPPPVDVDYGFASYYSKTKFSGNALKYADIRDQGTHGAHGQDGDLKKFYRIIASDERNTAVLKPSAHSVQR